MRLYRFLQISVSATVSLLTSWDLPGHCRDLIPAESSHRKFPFCPLHQALVWPAQSLGNYLEKSFCGTLLLLCAGCLHQRETVIMDCTGDMKSHCFVCPELLSLHGSGFFGIVEEQLFWAHSCPRVKHTKHMFGLFSARCHRHQRTSGSVPGCTIWDPEPTHQR